MTGRASLCPGHRVAANAAQATVGGACWDLTGKESAERFLEAPEEASAWPGESPCQLRVAATALEPSCLPESCTRDSSPVPGAGRALEGRARALAC